MKEAEVRETERFEDIMLLILKMEEGAVSQGMQAAFKRWQRSKFQNCNIINLSFF